MQHTAKKKRRQQLRGILGAAVSVLALYWVFKEVSLQELVNSFSLAKYPILLLAALTTLFSYVLRALRWPVFFKKNPPRFVDSFRCLILGFFMNNILPARMGEFVRAHLGGKATHQSRTYVLATIFGERLADGIVISLMFAGLFLLIPGHAETSEGYVLIYVAAMFFLVAICTALGLAFRETLFGLFEKLSSKMPGKVSRFALIRAGRFIEGLEPLLKPHLLLRIFLWSIAVWSVELLVYYQVTWAYSYHLSLGGLALFLAAVNFSSLVPAAPGAVGVIEAFATLALEQIGVPRIIALAMVITQHAIQILVVGIPGAFFFFKTLHGRVPKKDLREETEDESNLEDTLSDKVVKLDAQSEMPQDNSQAIDLSIVIPAYNEEQRLPSTLRSVTDYLLARNIIFEIIIVDDGSEDGTSTVVREVKESISQVRLINYGNNRGKGFAVRIGILNALGNLVLYNDADGATPIKEIERLENAIEEGAEIAIGSRAMFSKDTDVNTVWYRKFMGRVFNGFVNILVLPDIKDTQCGFKIFKRQVARDLFSRARADRFSFDVEILFLAKKANYQIAEVPINWTNVPGSKVNIVKDSIAMALDICKFRLRDLFGGYNKYIPEPSIEESAS